MNRFNNGRQPGDEALRVEFFIDSFEDQAATTKEGRPVYKDTEMIRIIVPAGEWAPSGEIRVTKVNDQHRQRFPMEYAAFKATLKEPTNGTPLKMWPAIGPSAVKELGHFGITTVEQLAGVSPAELRLHEWMQPYVDRASTWLAALSDNASVLQLQAEIAELQKRVQHLEAENTELLKELVNGVKSKPAKPAK